MRNLSAKLYQPGATTASATAWLIADAYALTAYHCILDAEDQPFPGHERFQLEFDSGKIVHAVVAEYSADADAAILQLLDSPFVTAGQITFGFLPANDVWTSLQENKKRWTGWGYPRGRPDGLLIEGSISQPDVPYKGGSAIQLLCDQGGAEGTPLRGMSGAAVVHDQALVGIISSGPRPFNQTVIFATPISRIADELKIMRAILSRHYQRELDRIDRDTDTSSGLAWSTAGSMNVSAEGITHRANLTYKSTRLYGRDEQVVDLRAKIEEGRRLVTLYGENGCGKSRLAHEVGKAFLGHYDGVFMADLQGCEDAASVLTEIANTLGVREAHDDLLEESLTVVIGERRVLLILDGAERLGESRGMIEQLLKECPHLRIMTAMHRPLGWENLDEYAFLVKPLVLHPEEWHEAQLMDHYGEAFVLQLFEDHARRASPQFRLNLTNIDLVDRLCKPAAGVPLAIEIIAGRAGPVIARGPTLLAAIDTLAPFEAALRDIEKLPWQERLNAIIKLAAEQLDADTRSLFLRLSAFSGGCTVEAAELVGADLTCPREEIGEKLALLVDRGLLGTGSGVKGKPYYRLQPAVLDYCRRKLEETGAEARLTARRHATYYAQLAYKAERRLTLLSSDELIDWFELLEFEYTNIRNALAWSERNAEDAEQVGVKPIEVGLGIVGNLFWFWNLRGSLMEGIRWSERLLAKSQALAAPLEASKNRGAALHCSGGLYYLRGDFGQAREHLAQCVAIWEAREDQRRLAFSLVLLGAVAMHQNDLWVALEHEKAALALFQRLDDRVGFALALNDLGNVMMETDKAKAERHYLDSLAVWQELRNYWGVGLSISNLGRLACAQEKFKEAKAQLLKALQIQARNRYQWGHAESLKFMGYTLLGAKNFQAAAREFRDSFVAHQRLGRKHLVADCLDGLGKVAVRLQRPLFTAYLFGAASHIREQTKQTLSPDQRAEQEKYIVMALAELGNAVQFKEEFASAAGDSFAEISRKTLTHAEQMITQPSPSPAMSGEDYA
jgi:predicted ATPase